LRLEIGGGILPKDGYVNVDYMDHPKVDYKVDLNSGELPFPDSSVSEIYTNHCLEHLQPGYSGFLHCIEEMWRVSKPNAPWYVRVPYFNSHHTLSNPFHSNNIFNEYTFYYFSDEHKNQYSSNVFIRKGSCFEYDFKATLIVDKIEYEFFDNYKMLISYPMEKVTEIIHKEMNVVNNITYHLRAEKPDFWTKERVRNGQRM